MVHKARFDSYDVKPATPRWSWSGKSDDGKTVAVTCWQDRFEKGIDLYRSHTHLGETGWQSRPGHNELILNLAWARDNCDGVVRIIIATPVDPNASPRSIKECFPQPDFSMSIVRLDEASGDFELERIKAA
ncbi:hypothetical protein [uncultured Bosea sp.]|uniref:hypothetical protein n=1 Tax=uncultured Bosea sp. TaxID=211457 RepID=UPI0025D7831C|nr:hypothetical protein [uncultured Bosea sp.]